MNRFVGALPAIILAAWGLWLVLVLAHGFGLNVWGTPLDFRQSGAFGDSFGGITALMAALAAAGALLTLQQQRTNSEIQNFDSNFFGLLGHFVTVVESTDAHNFISEEQGDGTEVLKLNYVYEGRDAFKIILSELRDKIEVDDFEDPEKVCLAYQSFYEDWQDDLGHYFRLLYHLFKLVDEKCTSDKTYYTRVIRAHLSNSEIFLLGYNCICGEGKEKFVDYLERYAVLHNIGYPNSEIGNAERGFFEQRLSEDVFKSGSEPMDSKEDAATPDGLTDAAK